MSLIALNLAVLLVVAGGTAAFGAFNKTVTLTVDGKSETVRTFGSNVDDVLKSKGITLKTQDRLSPARSTSLADGGSIKVDYARPLTLAVDGKKQDHITYERTVKDVLDNQGIAPKSGAYLSATLDKKIPRKGIDLVVSNPKKLKVVADGDTKKVMTAAPTVEEVLDTAGVKVDGDDEVKPGLDALVTEDTKLKVVRIETKTKTEEVKVKFPVEVTKDDELEKGKTEIVTPGKSGTNRENVTVTMADGKVRERVVHKRTVLTKPVAQVEKLGTAEAPSVSSGSVWDKIAKCESGGNWKINTGNGYYGGLQFSAATWHSVGGPGLPHENSRETQIKYAEILQKRSGWGQWGCAHARFD